MSNESFLKRLTHAFEHFPEEWSKASGGKQCVMGLVGATGIGIIIHGLVNAKRGLLGYEREDGTREDAALGNLVFGLAEIGAGAAGIYALVTGKGDHVHGPSCGNHKH